VFQKIDSEKLTILCEEQSVSREQLSESTGIHLESLQRIERIGFISSKDLKVVCSFLGVRPIKLLLPTPSHPWR
jgi:DNA-binding Xre family transcriptional regulator